MTDDKPSELQKVEAAQSTPYLPECKPNDLEVWFAMLEAAFSAANITSEKTKYAMMLQKLTSTVVDEVRDIILAPPADEPYSAFKAELLKRLGTTQDQKTRRLIESEEIGDQKPSQFLRRLQCLAGNNISESAMRTLWQSRLPTSLQPILATVKDQPLENAAELADAASVYLPVRPVVATASLPDTFIQEFQKLTTSMVAAIRKEMTPMRDSRRMTRDTQQRFRSRTHSNSRDSRTPQFCWYHRVYKEKATKCRQPCHWVQGNDQGSH